HDGEARRPLGARRAGPGAPRRAEDDQDEEVEPGYLEAARRAAVPLAAHQVDADELGARRPGDQEKGARVQDPSAAPGKADPERHHDEDRGEEGYVLVFHPGDGSRERTQTRTRWSSRFSAPNALCGGALAALVVRP